MCPHYYLKVLCWGTCSSSDSDRSPTVPSPRMGLTLGQMSFGLLWKVGNAHLILGYLLSCKDSSILTPLSLFVLGSLLLVKPKANNNARVFPWHDNHGSTLRGHKCGWSLGLPFLFVFLHSWKCFFQFFDKWAKDPKSHDGHSGEGGR